jgi:hypothetical protein
MSETAKKETLVREPVMRIEGKERTIRYPVMSVMKMEQLLDYSSLELLRKDADNPFSIRELVIILWAGLTASWPGLTLEKTVDLVEDASFDFESAADICKQELFKSLQQILRFKTGKNSKN